MKKIKHFFANIGSLIVLRLENEYDNLHADLIKLARFGEMEFSNRVRAEYIVLTKLARKAQADYDRVVTLWQEAKDKALQTEKDLETKMDELDAQCKAYKQKMFAHLGMFQAYSIRKVTEQELK